jgi:YfiH family protein
VRTADCVPVLLAAPGGVGVAHAGWRGAALGVVPAAVRALCEATGAAPAAVRAAIGPSIAGQRYEVGHEVVDALAASGVDPARFLVAGPGSRPHVDVADAVEAQLEALGVGRIARVRRCTAEDPELFSHRADGPATGRQAGVVARLA